MASKSKNEDDFVTKMHKVGSIYLRRFNESEPIGWVCWEQSHWLALVDGQRRAQEVTDQVDEALKPLLAGALQQLEGWENKRIKERTKAVKLKETRDYKTKTETVLTPDTHWQTWTWGPVWASRPSCTPSWWGRWRWCCLTCTWWTGSLGSASGGREPRPNSAVQ